jgi:hypothetical protein
VVAISNAYKNEKKDSHRSHLGNNEVDGETREPRNYESKSETSRSPTIKCQISSEVSALDMHTSQRLAGRDCLGQRPLNMVGVMDLRQSCFPRSEDCAAEPEEREKPKTSLLDVVSPRISADSDIYNQNALSKLASCPAVLACAHLCNGVGIR